MLPIGPLRASKLSPSIAICCWFPSTETLRKFVYIGNILNVNGRGFIDGWTDCDCSNCSTVFKGLHDGEASIRNESTWVSDGRQKLSCRRWDKLSLLIVQLQIFSWRFAISSVGVTCHSPPEKLCIKIQAHHGSKAFSSCFHLRNIKIYSDDVMTIEKLAFKILSMDCFRLLSLQSLEIVNWKF